MNHLARYDAALPAAAEWPGALGRIKPSTLRYWIGVVLSRGWRAFAVAVLLFGVVVGVVSQLPRTYYAEGSVLVQPSRGNPASVDQNQAGQPLDTSAVDTEVEMLKSRALSETVIEKLGLLSDPEFNPPTTKWHVAFSGQWPFILVSSIKTDGLSTEQAVNRTVDAVQHRTFVRRVGLTDVVHVGFSSRDPSKAQKIANGVIDAYLARQVTEKVKFVAQANEELDASVDKLRENALTTAASAEQYKNAHSILSPEGASMLEGEISSLDQQIAQAHANRVAKEAQLTAAMAMGRRGSAGADLPEALSSDTIRELRKQEAELGAQVAQLSAQFKPDYPEAKRAQAQLNDVRGAIRRELNRIHSSLTADARAAEQREASLIASRSQAENQLSTNNAARVALVALELRAEAAKKTYEGYLNRAGDVAAARSLQQADATVNYQAAVSVGSVSPNMRLAEAGAAMLALLGAALVILLPEFWSRRLRSSTDIEHWVGMPLAAALPDIASIAHARRLGGAAAPARYLSAEPFTAFAEAFRNLRAFLVMSDPSEPSKIIAVTSAVPREGKSVTSLCLAHILAQSGASVALVDCDVRRRGVTELVSGASDARVGIVEVIEKGLPLSEALIRDPKSGVWVLPVAGNQPTPRDLFGKKEGDRLFRKLAEQFDYVVLDTPPLLGVADARILATKADKVLFVVHWNKTPASAVQAAADILQDCGAKVAGAILARVNVRQQARYGYGDSSDYFRAYQHYYAPNS
ncbi:MAG TPA: AAA family ATPase [Stellaceae bacterium]|nr:AAA family ATPase [Stellaceae bacterium]